MLPIEWKRKQSLYGVQLVIISDFFTLPSIGIIPFSRDAFFSLFSQILLLYNVKLGERIILIEIKLNKDLNIIKMSSSNKL